LTADDVACVQQHQIMQCVQPNSKCPGSQIKNLPAREAV